MKEKYTVTYGKELWYDDEGRLVYFKDNDGYEIWWDFDLNGKIRHFKNSEGVEKWLDEYGTLIKFKDSNGTIECYDKQGLIVQTNGV